VPCPDLGQLIVCLPVFSRARPEAQAKRPCFRGDASWLAVGTQSDVHCVDPSDKEHRRVFRYDFGQLAAEWLVSWKSRQELSDHLIAVKQFNGL
jgi:hypothetical protein